MPFFYENDVKHALHKMKFRGRLDLIKPFAGFAANALRERGLLSKTDVITYIPMSKKELRRHSCNQAEHLAKEIGKQTGLPVKQLLYKTAETPSQHSLGLNRRKGNMIGIFEPLKECLPDIENKTVLVVDDIITTGSTLNEAAKTLLIFGAEDVYAAGVAQGKKKKHIQEKENSL